MDPTDRIEEEIALFALGAIDGPERHVIEAHLKKCARCRARLEEAQAAAGLLPAALDPILPSGHSREKLLSRVRSDPRTGRAKLLRPLRALFSLHIARIGLIFVGLIAIVTLMVYAAQVNPNTNLFTFGTGAAAAARTLKGTALAPRADGRLLAAPDDKSGELVVNGLGVLAPGKCYELWLVRKNQMEAAGTFEVDTGGRATMAVSSDQPLSHVDRFLVTVERSGGVPVAEGPVVLQDSGTSR